MSKWNDFDIIWNKESPKSRQVIMQKVICRGLEPTKENCRDYYMGYIRYYVDGWTGQGHHLNPRKNKIMMKMLKRRQNNDNRRRPKGGKKPPYKVGRNNKKKK